MSIELKIKEKTSDLGDFFMDGQLPHDIDVGNQYRLELTEVTTTGNGNKEKTELRFKLTA